MKRGLAVGFAVALAMVAFAGSREGIAPRSSAGDYAVQKQSGTLSLGVARLSNEQVKNSFSADVERGYVVIEIGVFPGEGGIDLRRDDFVLRGSGKDGAYVLRPASPQTVAGVLQKKNKTAGAHDVDVYPHGSIGYSTGVRDPYGRQYPGGVTTAVGVGVGVGNNAPAASTDADRRTMETELRDKILPEGEQTAPVAGYLYFPIATKDKVSYQLEYRAPGRDKILMPLPDAKK
jgi:hypothetical protein